MPASWLRHYDDTEPASASEIVGPGKAQSRTQSRLSDGEGPPLGGSGVTDEDLVDRTREIMAQTGVSWKKAWPRALSELGPVNPTLRDERQRRGCLLGGLRASFLIILASLVYGATVVVLLLIPPVEQFMSNNPYGFVVAVPALGLGALVAGLVAQRFRKIPVVLMAGAVLVVAGTILGSVVYGIASGPSEGSIAAANRYEELRLELVRSVSSVPVPDGWEVEYLGGYSASPSVGITFSPDLSSSGNRMHIYVVDQSEDAFWEELDSTVGAEPNAALALDPVSTSLSGVPGYLFEVSGLIGNKTGQALGAHWAVFFGPDYTYVVIMQYQLADRQRMGEIWRQSITRLTLAENAEQI